MLLQKQFLTTGRRHEPRGLQLANRLKPLRPQMRVLYQSGYSEEGVFASQAPFLQKPFNPKDLANKVGEVLDGREAIR